MMLRLGRAASEARAQGVRTHRHGTLRYDSLQSGCIKKSLVYATLPLWVVCGLPFKKVVRGYTTAWGPVRSSNTSRKHSFIVAMDMLGS